MLRAQRLSPGKMRERVLGRLRQGLCDKLIRPIDIGTGRIAHVVEHPAGQRGSQSALGLDRVGIER
jgi:hypothetical protein